VVYVGCRDSNLYAVDAATGKEKWRFNNEGSWVITSPAVKGGKVFFATSDSSLYQVVDAATGKSLLREDTKAYVFSSPAIADDVVVYGVLNGTLQARDANTGTLLWEYQTEASKANKGWVLSSERKFNAPLLYYSPWREAATVEVDRQFSIGVIFSSPLILNGIVYFTSTDGCLYALE
jgi:outer membrane protein assembly factor BamB